MSDNTDSRISDPLRWQWCKPDRLGVWAFAGNMARRWNHPTTVIDPHPDNPEGWWCFLMPMPTILPPNKKTVWRMWAIPSRIEYQWLPEGKQPSRQDAIRTDKTEEREE